ncbi:MAG: hypothetical protein IPJ46_12915 [Anaerolineales bacterium]|nr:hypothetical protein [Anaerolineales bacterium]
MQILNATSKLTIEQFLAVAVFPHKRITKYFDACALSGMDLAHALAGRNTSSPLQAEDFPNMAHSAHDG